MVATAKPKKFKTMAIPLSNYPLQTGDTLLSAGFGLTKNGDDRSASRVLLAVELVVQAAKKCARRFPQQIRDTLKSGNYLCQVADTQDDSTGKGLCLGDSGGPSVKREGRKNFVQVGITSFGELDGCALEGSTNWSTDVRRFADIILDYPNNAEQLLTIYLLEE